jgi:ATP-dependent DNA ligase
MNLETHATLYKLDSTGKVRQWGIQAKEDDDGFYYEQIHGVVGGKLQSTSTRINEGKNVGKSNETDARHQCVSEARSLWLKQRDRKGYTESIPTEKPQPMLAKSYKDNGKKITWPAFCQPKLDGIRCAMTIDMDGNITFKSRQNKEFKSLGHIADAVRPLLPQLEGFYGMTFDGELYNHELKQDFQTLVSLIKRDHPSSRSNLIEYHVYDIYHDDDFINRNTLLKKSEIFGAECIKYVPTTEVHNLEAFLEEYQNFVGLGYEGAMLRNALGPYECNRRSPNLQKYKEFLDAEFKIVGAYENVGKQAGQCTFECITRDGAVFGVKPRGTDAQRKQMWTDFQQGNLTDKYMTVRFFAWTTSILPVPRFPVGIAIRDYE